ncbi:hypothetical protein JD79_04379 [Geodermatophilus normandii]|uniref:Protein NO VEIN C-terminal domain-containing protein n=1 Tax=Geodermatophilus normandii TaxID=1137989 RepID=A0A317QQR4_9ACTN|nr:hypothetical protein [Geodermatophilus normandii]PWW25181.1 hypothetical protein JD79_04379 [Geodermatophilus normandii]
MSVDVIGGARRLVEDRIHERAVHETAEQVQTTCSFARAERLLGREYHGRFLIELLQNAADAWRLQAGPGERSPVRVVLDTDGPALVVANQGAEFPAQVVLDSLGHIGRSTKAQGEAIGHKGIGFKSVLEVSATPELYSGLGPQGPRLAVRFDAEAALLQIRERSSGWEKYLSEVPDVEREVDAVPVLRFPRWVEEPPPVVAELAAEGFTTVIRLPFTGAGPVQDWLAVVRRALDDDVTDQILLLLGTFDEVVVDDRLANTRRTVAPSWQPRELLSGGIVRESVLIRRDGAPSSSWFLYRQGNGGLADETAVGVRVQPVGEGPPEVVPPLEGDAGAPFHLFFPTRIASGLPLLLHGYFEVDAARTGFYEGSAVRNREVLEALGRLSVQALADLAETGAVDLLSLVERLAATTPPDDPHARRFREAVLAGLDDVAWVPLAEGGDTPRRARPVDCLVTGDGRLDDALLTTFPAEYLERQSKRRVADPALSGAARALLLARRPTDVEEVWAEVGTLLRPGSSSPWPEGGEDNGFRALLDLVTVLQALDRRRCEELLTSLRGDPQARLLPVPAPDGGRRLFPLPAPEDGVRGRTSSLVMGRVREAGAALQPPAAMDVVFLRDGLLASEADGDRAKPLGVRPFTVDTVLDRLAAVQDAEGGEVVTFLWSLLARERGHEFGTAKGAHLVATLDPAQWFWCQPGRAELTENDRAKQRRQRRLSDVRLPARDGSWRPAGTLAFGDDWADWLETWAPADQATTTRAATYRALGQVAPDDGALLGAPQQVLPLLPELTGLLDDDAADPDDEADPDAAPRRKAARHLVLDGRTLQRERLAFLLRLGVWEVLPVEAHENRRETQNPERPWAGLRSRLRPGVDAGWWDFDAPRWAGRGHLNVRVSEDFRFRWVLDQPDVAGRLAVAALLDTGAGLYGQLMTAAAFCQSCSDAGHGRHGVRYRTGVDDRGVSTLALQLTAERWVPTSLAGEPQPEGAAPGAVWWAENPPSDAGMANSPLRFLPLLHRKTAMSSELRRLCGITDLEHSTPERLTNLLRDLRAGVESGAVLSGSGRQALIGLHRLAYGRLSELGESGAALLQEVGVLCELDGSLVYRPPGEARHDDDRFATYRRYFTGVVPFVVLARDKGPVARRLGLTPFEVTVRRQAADAGTDVTAEMSDALAERLPELFAVLVHHSLGAQTLEPTSNEFETRSRRLQGLVVRQVADLVLDVEAVGTGRTVVVGEGSVHDLFLDGATTLTPVLFHDLDGPDWPRRLRTRLASHLAVLVENTAYTATFQLLLLAEDDAERERVLHDLGISTDDVDAVRLRLGAVTEMDRRTSRVWFDAVLSVLYGVPTSVGPHAAAELRAAGLPPEVAEQVAAAGGGQSVRTDAGPVLRLLDDAGVDLVALDRRLRDAGDPGLEVRAATQQLRAWKALHGRRLVAVLAGAGASEEAARAGVDGLLPPPVLALVLDPAPTRVLAGVGHLLTVAGLAPDVEALVANPLAELVRLARAQGPADLDERVDALYVDDERRRVLARLAASWRTETAFFGTLARTTPGETRAATRGHHDAVGQLLPSRVVQPSDLCACLPQVFVGRPGVQDRLAARLVDSVTAPGPDRAELLAELSDWLPVTLAETVETALAAPVKELVRQVRDRVGRLGAAGLAPTTPAGLATPTDRAPRRPGPTTVPRVTVDASVDQRKKRLGDEAESWALACVVRPLLALAPAERAAALEEVADLLRRDAQGAAVEAALAHLPAASSPDAEEEDLLADLAGLLHVSRHGDGFGYDLLGWLPTHEGAAPQPVALEVKSSAHGRFLLSRNEWATAQRFSAAGEGAAYAVLVVRRGASGATPARLDLLPDPVRLREKDLLRLEEDTYQVRYAVR